METSQYSLLKEKSWRRVSRRTNIRLKRFTAHKKMRKMRKRRRKDVGFPKENGSKKKKASTTKHDRPYH
jgi:hypothetical protein